MELLADFHFLRPLWLLLLLPAAALVAALYRGGEREGDWSRAVAPELLQHLLEGGASRRSRQSLIALALLWTIAAVAAAGPSWQKLPQPVLQKQDALAVVMDLSFSMLATDLAPSRVDRMRRKVQDLLRQRREGLSALIAYAGDAHVVAPLTDDNRTIANLLPALDPTMMPLPGSNAIQAVELALELFSSGAVRSGRVLLVTDGVDAADRELLATLLEGTPHRLAVLGVGTEVGAPIPLPQGGFLKDRNGEIVVPALDGDGLADLARAAGGPYREITVDDSDLEELLAATASVLDDESVSRDRDADEWQDMAHWFVLPLLAACLVSFRRGAVYSLALLCLLPAADSRAGPWEDLWLRRDQQGQRALAAGDAERAAALFEDRDWRGTAAYRGGDYDTALSSFARGDDADAWYNRGNALAAHGELEAAIAAYERSLQALPEQEDALKNIETLKKLLEQQQQQQQQDQQQNQQSSDQGPQQQQGQQGEEQDDESQPSEQQPGEQQSQQPDADPRQQDEGGEEGQREGEEQQPSEAEGKEGQESQQQAQPLSPQIDNSAMRESMERDQALEQWLRRVPDDPSGLLREKFRYESRLRQQQGDTRPSEKIW